MKRFSQTVKIGLALFVAVFSNGTLSAAAAAMPVPDETNVPETEIVQEATAQTLSSEPEQDSPVVPSVQAENQALLGGPGGHDGPGEPGSPGQQDQKVTPVAPTYEDKCGTMNDSVTLPVIPQGITYAKQQNNSGDWTIVTVTATANRGYMLQAGNGYVLQPDKTAKYTLKLSNKLCEISIPGKPEVNDPCGLNNAEWDLPKDTDKVYWVLKYGNLTANTKYGYVFTNDRHQTRSYEFGKAHDSGELCPVKPEAPKFIDYCGTRTDYVYIPHVKGVIYKIDGKIAHEGYHKVSGTVTVTAKADNDHVLVGREQGPWTHEFTETDCVSVTKSSQPVTDTNGDGVVGVGDIVTWNITVTNNSDNDYDNFRVELTDSSATLVDNDDVTGGVIKHLKHGASVSVTATSTLNTSDVAACKATNTIQFQAWYNKHGHDRSYRENDGNFMQEKAYDFTGSSNEATATFTCPTPGSGSSSSTVVTVSEETPTVLPSTGPSDSNPLVILAGSAIAYLATYFIQRRRELIANN